jgi:uncharacterized protein YfaS (alpha-2-macroglobulin family)
VAQALKRRSLRYEGLEKKLPEYVSAGMKRLLELQQADGGWGWNGNGQTHEMMTPYALYGLLEAEKAGYKVPSEEAVSKGLARLKEFIDNLGDANGTQVADRVYCMYVYGHRQDLEPGWWDFLDRKCRQKQLSDYATALALELAAKGNKKDLAERLARSLASSAKTDNDGAHWTTANFSRWGNDQNEITAVALKALVARNPNDPLAEQALAWLAGRKQGNRWNSTKDTAMIVYAICDYLAAQKETGQPDATEATVALTDGDAKAMRFDNGLASSASFNGGALRHGKNTLRIGGGVTTMLHRVALRWRKEGRDVAPLVQGVTVTRSFRLHDPQHGWKELKAGDTVPRGSYIQCNVQASSPHHMRYALLEAPKPSGCEAVPLNDPRYPGNNSNAVLREDKAGALYFHYEDTHGGNLYTQFYLHADMEGSFVVPPAAVELMYDPDKRGHSGSFHFAVQGK